MHTNDSRKLATVKPIERILSYDKKYRCDPKHEVRQVHKVGAFLLLQAQPTVDTSTEEKEKTDGKTEI